MSDGKVLFTVKEDEKLVKILKKFPCIYDASLQQYKDQSVKDNAWLEISECIERSVDDCKKRWRNIKDTYKKRQKKGKSTAGSRGKKWPLADSLTFLNEIDHKLESMPSIPSRETHSQKDAMTEETAQLPSTSSTKDSQSQIVEEDIPTFERNHTTKDAQSRSLKDILTLGRNHTTKDAQSRSLKDILTLGRNHTTKNIECRGVEEIPTFERNHTTRDTQSQNMEENIPTYRRPSKRPRQNENIFELMDSWGIEREKRDDDDVDLFFKSIACCVKKLKPDLINEAKMQFLQMVIDLENRNSLALNSPQGSSRSPSSYSHLESSPSSVDFTIKSEFDDT
ncbi:hypothetical protein AVEN_3661-1 [Araneus ventricosus]|uniref:MADF domain-containing protein n=1 Tax=Araneus ventricosus TaxID=182803 RepID=A0A4Y2TQT4_ARAVE|nr:hypothetical protein AVEN_3661-1 [Araneus ventricosus]